MQGSRRFSQAISEGDGISVIVPVGDAGAAGAAQAQGAEPLLLTRSVDGVRDASALPILWRGGRAEDAERAGANAFVLVVEEAADDDGRLEELHDAAVARGLEVVVDVRDEEELELV